MNKLKSLTIRGFRSIESLEEFEPGDVCVLIGANGAGKSNFVEFFRMVRRIADQSLQKYLLETASDALFYFGPPRATEIAVRLELTDVVLSFELHPRAGGGAFVTDASIARKTGDSTSPEHVVLRAAGEISIDAIEIAGQSVKVHEELYSAVSSWTVYHVHDTSLYAPLRGWGSSSNNVRLTADASNLAAVLLGLRHEDVHLYAGIRDTVRLAAPFFDDFVLRPQMRGREEQVRLEWTQRGSQEPFQPTVLSDGTLRFIALITALLQPSPPSTIVIDEPELGLHPSAIMLLGEAIRAASKRTQVIVATQSPLLLDCFDAGEVAVVERENGRSVFRRLDAQQLTSWLEDYSLGELWLKNLLGGRPGRD